MIGVADKAAAVFGMLIFAANAYAVSAELTCKTGYIATRAVALRAAKDHGVQVAVVLKSAVANKAFGEWTTFTEALTVDASCGEPATPIIAPTAVVTVA